VRGWLAFALLLAGCAGAAPDPPRTVERVDLPRYLGTWYEIARLPFWAQDSGSVACEDVTATYTARDDGRVGVRNRCNNALAGDAPREAVGQAYAVQGSDGARLRVAFFWPFFGNYWVIGLDPDYRWAVVGEPERRWLWVLSRTPTMAAADFTTVKAIAQREGFPVERLRLTRQGAAPQPG
jgi:apolipoprotein D and lipocalin family protein